jgi:hypothetical protein
MNRMQFRRSIFPVTQEVLMSITSRFRGRQGELFAPTMPQPQVPQEAYQRMLRLLTRMMNEHLEKDLRPRVQTEVGDE